MTGIYLEEEGISGHSYRDAGVDIDAGQALVEAIKPLARATDLFREQMFADHPLHKPVLGYRETVRALSRDSVVGAARRFYRPTPPVLAAAVFGAMDLKPKLTIGQDAQTADAINKMGAEHHNVGGPAGLQVVTTGPRQGSARRGRTAGQRR